ERRGRADLEEDAAAVEAAKAFEPRLDPVASRHDLRDEVVAAGAAHDFAEHTGVVVGDHDGDARQDGARRVRDLPADPRSAGLRERRCGDDERDAEDHADCECTHLPLPWNQPWLPMRAARGNKRRMTGAWCPAFSRTVTPTKTLNRRDRRARREEKPLKISSNSAFSAVNVIAHRNQNSSFPPIWICRESIRVLVMTPKVGVRSWFPGWFQIGVFGRLKTSMRSSITFEPPNENRLLADASRLTIPGP